MLPSGTAGLYLGGGFPEVHAAELAGNTALLATLRAAIADGVPTPVRILQREDGSVVRRIDDVAPGDALQARLSDGRLKVRVESSES